MNLLILFLTKGSGNILTFDYTATDHAKGKYKLQFIQAILSDSNAKRMEYHWRG
ncbi:hypothetical protein MHK_009912 [Candidatus Magnetomorum sp. HK-1]|nr:hypothetical protein MHK_009912 [Candidatus Magnetomorum sp. HK-1]